MIKSCDLLNATFVERTKTEENLEEAMKNFQESLRVVKETRMGESLWKLIASSDDFPKLRFMWKRYLIELKSRVSNSSRFTSI